MIEDTSTFSVISHLLDKAELKQNLNYSASVLLTFFAPTDAGFAKGSSELGIHLVPCLADPENNNILQTFLKYHMVGGAFYSSMLSFQTSLKTEVCNNIPLPPPNTLSDEPLPTVNCYLNVLFTDSGISVGMTGSIINQADIPASNGVIHAVSLPLVPPTIDLKETCKNHVMVHN